MSLRRAIDFLVLLSLLSGIGRSAHAVTLVGDPFITSYENWVDPAPDRGGNWRTNLGHDYSLAD